MFSRRDLSTHSWSCTPLHIRCVVGCLSLSRLNPFTCRDVHRISWNSRPRLFCVSFGKRLSSRQSDKSEVVRWATRLNGPPSQNVGARAMLIFSAVRAQGTTKRSCWQRYQFCDIAGRLLLESKRHLQGSGRVHLVVGCAVLAHASGQHSCVDPPWFLAMGRLGEPVKLGNSVC